MSSGARTFLPQEVIRSKRDGARLTDTEIAQFVAGLTDGSGNVYMHYTARYYFYKNKDYVKAVVVLRNADLGTSNTFATAYKGFQSFELRITPNITGTLNYSIASYPTDGNCPSGVCSGALNQAGGTDSAFVYQGQSLLMDDHSCTRTSACANSFTPDTVLNSVTIIR